MAVKVALIGLGQMGRNHARELKDLGVLGCCADINPVAKQVAKELGVPFVKIDVSEFIEVRPGAPISYKLKNLESLPSELNQCEAWDIATTPKSHLPILLLGGHLDKDIFIEKPPLESAEEIEYVLCQFPRVKLGVDYVEMAHPVLEVIRKEMSRLNLKPIYFLHHREKNQLLERGKAERVILDDLVHDLSEIDFIRSGVLGKPFSVDLPKVSKSWLQEYYKETGFASWNDARAEFSLEFKDGSKAEIKGSFIDSYHRQFVIVTDRNTAFYGNTLERNFIAPAVAVIKGRENIAGILEATKKCAIKDEETQRLALETAKARLLVLPSQAGKVSLRVMLKNFLEAASNKDLICSLEKAYYYQKVAEEAYEVSGRPHAMLSIQ